MSNADVVELADTIDLGSIAFACRFKSCHPHQLKEISIWIFLLIYVDYMTQNRKAEGFSKPHASVMLLQHNLWREAVQDVLSPAPKRTPMAFVYEYFRFAKIHRGLFVDSADVLRFASQNVAVCWGNIVGYRT